MSPRIAFSVALVVSFASASAALAAPVVFDNTDRRFVWRSSANQLPPFYVTVAPEAQPSPGTVLPLPSISGVSMAGHTGGSAVLTGGGTGGVLFTWASPAGGNRTLSPGEEVGPAMTFGDLFLTASFGRPGAYSFPGGLVGISFRLNGAVHYGGLDLSGIQGLYPQPLRWGYESEPGVPFPISAVVPEPGALALLAGAGCLALRRRRR